MSVPARPGLVAPADLPHVWRTQALARVQTAVVSTGHAALDAQLPGGGWPVGGMVEVLQARSGQHVWQLLLPGLAQATCDTTAVRAAQAGPVVLVGAPFEPFGPGLAAQGLPGERLLCVRADKPMARLWAAEQALRCADVAAVLAWLPQVNSAQLRRLHLAAQQHNRLLFVFRGLRAAQESSPALVRLQLEGAQALLVRILKRRGPPLEGTLALQTHPARLAALLAARQGSGVAPAPAPAVILFRRPHALDRAAAVS